MTIPPDHQDRAVRCREIGVDGQRIFYREAGSRDAPAVLLPHGYPSSSFEFRNLMPLLADRWRLVAPDFPGFGYSATPEGRAPDFDDYAAFLGGFADAIGLTRFALYLHDYGSQIGLRLAIARPEAIAALIIQNGDIYEDTLGPRYAFIKAYWAEPTPERRRVLEEAVSEEGFRDEFTDGLSPEIAARVPPDMWNLSWPLMDTPARKALSVGLMEGLKENLDWFPRYQAYLRDNRPPALIVWGPRDGYMPEAAARAYLRDLPDAELHLIEDGSHWLLETHLDKVAGLIREFLERAYPPLSWT